MGIEYVNGRRYARAVAAGADWVLHTREKLNRLNVFPVPDGDTGTNLALSLSATAAAVRDTDERDFGVVARTVAEASILGAKGNSGLIFAHWFLGMAQSVGDRAKVLSQELADAFADAAREVYEAVDKPVEGTILTVMRAAGEAAQESARAGRNVEGVLDDVIDAAESSLAETPELLKPLKDAGVVDAGAQGYVNFMKGVRRALRGEPPPDLSIEDLEGQSFEHPEGAEDDLSERYCTELICRGEGFDAKKLKKLFAEDGSYLLVAATTRVFKLHVHTNHPDRVFAKAEKLGTLAERKVDDMLKQREERSLSQAPVLGHNAQPGTPAVVVDSTADLPESVRREHGIEMVPLQVLFGSRVFRDQVDLTTDEFYAKIGRGETATTSQPPPRAFVEAFDRIRNDREVIVVSLAESLSGTIKSARSATGLSSHPRIEVFDSRSASMGTGLMALGAARLAARGMPTEEVLTWLDRWARGTRIGFTCATLEHLKRGGRITAAQALIGGLLGFKPVLLWDGSEVVNAGKVRTEAGAQKKVREVVTQGIAPGSRIRLGLIAAGEAPAMEGAADAIRAQFDVVEEARGAFTGVIGAHTGPGTWGIVVQEVPDGDPLA